MYNVKQATIKGWFGENKTKYVVTKDNEELGKFNSDFDAFSFIASHKRINHVSASDDQQLKLTRDHEIRLLETKGKYCMDCRESRAQKYRDHELELARAGLKRLYY